jgi:predicted SAM-dependent methyltransferase
MEKIKLNLGAGKNRLKGFVNVDLQEFGKGYLKADVRNLPLETNSVDYILARQILEHIPFREIESTLKEWLRVLKKGGKMVVTCPDFNQLAEQWLSNEFTPENYEEMAQGIYGNQSHEYEHHLSPITPQFLRYTMNRLGKDAEINVYQAGDKMIHYPGIEKEDKIYRYGEVHLIIK